MLETFMKRRREARERARWAKRRQQNPSERYFGPRADTQARIAAARRYPCCGQVVRLPHRLERMTQRVCRRCGRAWLVVRLTSFAELDHRGRVRLKWVEAPGRPEPARCGATGPSDPGVGLPEGPAPA